MSDKKVVTLSIDGKEVSVEPGTTVIKAAEKVGKLIPHFCYHPGLSVVGQCRMCFVEIEGAPKLATACSTPVGEGMKIITDSEKVKQGQNGTLEFTLLNHPLDCPICDRGGECKLQDYTYEYGPALSRMDDEKALRSKHRVISEQIVLDQERCILCTRCIRFSDEIDGKTELVVNNRGSANVVDLFPGKSFTSAFSGNVVDICPVGALTAKDFRFAARPWELKRHDALCTGCSMGCNVTIDTKHRHTGITRPDGSKPNPKIVRLMPRDNNEVNTWWMCDYGRWGYHFHNEDQKRLQRPMLKRTESSAFEDLSLREIQAVMDQQEGAWEFWVDDNVSTETLRWTKELASSWKSRSKNVAGINPCKFGDEFLEYWSELSATPNGASKVNWPSIKRVLSPWTLNELEERIPILKLRIEQLMRNSGVVFQSFKSPAELKTNKGDLVLLEVAENSSQLALYKKIPKDVAQLMLFTRTNSRGIINEGIAPVDAVARSLSAAGPSGPVFFVSQTAQRNYPEAFLKYLAKAPFVVVADSFTGEHVNLARVALPLNPLYESPGTFTNVENIQQHSAGIKLSHPNQHSIDRGGDAINPALRLL